MRITQVVPVFIALVIFVLLITIVVPEVERMVAEIDAQLNGLP